MTAYIKTDEAKAISRLLKNLSKFETVGCGFTIEAIDHNIVLKDPNGDPLATAHRVIGPEGRAFWCAALIDERVEVQ
jgi:hypothetical protein